MSTAAASGRQISGHVDGSDQDNSAEPPRVKRWAPRSRTGCLGCRARRVKCDEGRPKCKSCQKRNMDCFYELNPPGSALSSDSMPIPSILIRPKPTVTRSSDDSAGHSMCDVSQPACRRCAYSGLLSPKPEALPGVGESHSRTGASTVANCSGSQRYGVTAPPPSTSRGLSVRRQLNSCLLDRITKSQAIPIKYHRPQGKNPANFEAFTAFILAYRITQISRDQGTLTQPSEAYHTKHLWERLYTCIFNQITCINNEIARLDSSDAQRNRVLTRIQGIKCVEIMLQSPIWRNHMEGFLSLLRFCGGAKFAQAQPAVIRNGKGMIMESILANSVAPPDNQIIGVSFFTTEELMFFHREILHPSLPCPTDLFWGIIETNKLRVKMHSNPGLGYLAAALTILQRINAFQPTAWKESSYELPNIPEVPLIATIYQLAVGLYCLMALQDAGLGSMDKAEQCRALLASLEVAWRLEHCRDALNWPLAVVGCALADGGTPSEQAFVCQCLKDAAQHVFAVHPLVILSTLKRFWASGMTHWDKCWREPCPIMG